MLTIFVWRIVAKSFCHFILPPTFRFLSHLFTLPHRRFYTPATDYTSVPPEKGLRPIPSVIDLPRMVELEVDGVGVASSARRNGTYGAVKQRAGRAARQEVSEKGTGGKDGASQAAWGGSRKNGLDVKHYDADGESLFPCPGVGQIARAVHATSLVAGVFLVGADEDGKSSCSLHLAIQTSTLEWHKTAYTERIWRLDPSSCHKACSSRTF